MPSTIAPACSQTCHQRRILCGDESRAQARARFAAQARHDDGTLDAERHAVQRAQLFVVHHRGLGILGGAPARSASTCTNALSFGFSFSICRQMGVDEFDRRDFLFPDLLGHGNGGKEGYIVHERPRILIGMARSSIRFSST